MVTRRVHSENAGPAFGVGAFYGTVSSLRSIPLETDFGRTGPTTVIDQDYSSTLESVDIAEGEIMKEAEAAGFDEDSLHQISMAARECLVNAVVHGNRYNRNKTVHLSVSTESGKITIKISDQGDGFERQEVPDPLQEENVLRHSGRGLFLMEAFMDEMSVAKAEPNGTVVTLVKSIESH